MWLQFKFLTILLSTSVSCGPTSLFFLKPHLLVLKLTDYKSLSLSLYVDWTEILPQNIYIYIHKFVYIKKFKICTNKTQTILVQLEVPWKCPLCTHIGNLQTVCSVVMVVQQDNFSLLILTSVWSKIYISGRQKVYKVRDK